MKRNINITRATISMAANELGRERHFDSLTVDEICEVAGISRSTFYRAFDDKYAILMWCGEIPFERGIAQMGRTLTCLEGATITLEGFGLFNDLFYSTRSSSERGSREENGIEYAQELFLKTAVEVHHEKRDRDLEFQAHWAASCLLETAVAMSSGKHSETPAQAALLVANAFPPRLRAIMDAPPDHAPISHLNMGSLVLHNLHGEENN